MGFPPLKEKTKRRNVLSYLEEKTTMDPNKKEEKDENDNDNDKSRKGMATMRRRRKAPTTMINREGGG